MSEEIEDMNIVVKRLSDEVAIQAMLQIEREMLPEPMYTQLDELTMLRHSKGFALLLYSEKALEGVAIALPLSEIRKSLAAIYKPFGTTNRAEGKYLYLFSVLVTEQFNVVSNQKILLNYVAEVGKERRFTTGCTHMSEDYGWGKWLPGIYLNETRRQIEMFAGEVGLNEACVEWITFDL
jgi:hypothetical protein